MAANPAPSSERPGEVGGRGHRAIITPGSAPAGRLLCRRRRRPLVAAACAVGAAAVEAADRHRHGYPARRRRLRCSWRQLGPQGSHGAAGRPTGDRLPGDGWSGEGFRPSTSCSQSRCATHCATPRSEPEPVGGRAYWRSSRVAELAGGDPFVGADGPQVVPAGDDHAAEAVHHRAAGCRDQPGGHPPRQARRRGGRRQQGRR